MKPFSLMSLEAMAFFATAIRHLLQITGRTRPPSNN
jgi:hypothetical protein